MIPNYSSLDLFSQAFLTPPRNRLVDGLAAINECASVCWHHNPNQKKTKVTEDEEMNELFNALFENNLHYHCVDLFIKQGLTSFPSSSCSGFWRLFFPHRMNKKKKKSERKKVNLQRALKSRESCELALTTITAFMCPHVLTYPYPREKILLSVMVHREGYSLIKHKSLMLLLN